MFATARGRAIEVSAEALARVQVMFQEETKNDAEQAGHGEPVGNHSQESGPQQSVAFHGGGQGNKILEGVIVSSSSSSETRRNSRAPGCMDGGGIAGGAGKFSTGSGRRVEVSAEALAQAQKRFGDVEAEVEATSSSTDGRASGGHLTSTLGGRRGSGGGDGSAGTNGSGSGSGSWGSVFSTGRGKSVEVSPAALSQAYKRFGADADGGQHSLPGARPPCASRSTASPPPAAVTGFPLPRVASSASGAWCGAGKENREQGSPRKRGVGTPSASHRRSGGTSTAFSPPGRVRGAMPPPIATAATAAATAGVSTPSSAGKLLGPRATPSPARIAGGRTAGAVAGAAGAAAAAASPACPTGRIGGGGGGSGSTTPQSVTKRRGFGGGYGGGLHSMKRPRLPALAATPSASASSPMRALTTPRGLRLGGGGGNSVRGAFPRPSPARLAAGGGSGAGLGVAQNAGSNHPSTSGTPAQLAATGDDENNPAGCRASRMLFGAPGSPEKGKGSAEAAADGSASARKEERRQRRDKGRRPLSSLLDPPPQTSAESWQRHFAGAVGAGAAAGAVGAGAATLGAAAGGDNDKAGAPAAEQPSKKLNSADAEEGGLPQKEQRSAYLGRSSGGEAVADLLARVTAENACDLRFGDDGRPLCFAPPASSPGSSAAIVPSPPSSLTFSRDEPSRGSRTPGGEVEGKGQEQGETRPPPVVLDVAAAGAFRDELLRSGRDGQMATPAWVQNHTR